MAENRAGSGKNPGPGLEAARWATAPTLLPRVRRSGADAHLGLGKFKSDGDREEEGKKTPSGEATGGVLTSRPAGRAAPASPAPLRASDFLGMGPGVDAGLQSRRCTAGREGRALGREEIVTRRNITNNFLSPSPAMSLLPNIPGSAVRASPACTAATSPSRDREAGLGSARGRLRAKEGFGKDMRG